MQAGISKTGGAWLLATAMLVGCGGVDDSRPAGDGDALFGRDGRPSALARQAPANSALRTRAGLYAAPEDVAWQTLIAEPYTVLVEVDRHASPDAAVETTLRNYRWSPEGPLAAFFVSSSDPAQAAAVADELTASGVPNVFLVLGAR